MKSSYGMTKREIAAKNRPDVSTLYGWLEHHRTHGRPYKDAKIGEFFVYRCTCSETFKFNEDERTLQPIRFHDTSPK